MKKRLALFLLVMVLPLFGQEKEPHHVAIRNAVDRQDWAALKRLCQDPQYVGPDDKKNVAGKKEDPSRSSSLLENAGKKNSSIVSGAAAQN